MKNIKKFESFTYQGEYWLLPTDERFEKSLKEIGCPKQQIFRFLSRLSRHLMGSFVFIGCRFNNNPQARQYGWIKYDGGELKNDFYEGESFKFSGTINIEEYELESEKYNL